MDERLLSASDAVNAFWTNVAYISLDASLNRRAFVITLLNATTADARSLADMVYEAKVTVANDTLAATVGPAKAIRDAACAGALEIYARSIEAPTAVFAALRKSNDENFAGSNSACDNVLRLAEALGQEEYEVALEQAQNDEERERARQVFQSAKQAAHQEHLKCQEIAYSTFNAKHREASAAFNLATVSARSVCREATEAHNKAFADINRPAEQARSETVRAAFDEREKRIAEIDAEQQREFALIQSRYASERRLRVAALRTSRLVVDAYFSWLSAFVPPVY